MAAGHGSSEMTQNAHDVVIVGGGMAGLAGALALGRAGLRTLVLDAAPAERRVAPEFDGRASAVAYANFRMLGRLGVAGHLEGRVQPITEILVSDGHAPDGLRRGGPGPAFLHFAARELDDREDGEPLGYMIENRWLRHALLAALDVAPNVTHRAPARVADVALSPESARLTLADGEEIRAPLVVGAEGAASLVREAMGVRSVGWDYPQAGLVATVRHEKPHGGMAHEYFLPSGPFAILPLTEDRASLVWTERRAAAAAAMALDEAGFEAEVRRRFGGFLGALRVEGPRFSYPLGLRVAEAFVRPRAALLGDAARRIHPIAGQGLNLGFKDAAALADVLAEASRVGLDLGGLDVLERYQRWRRFDSVMLAAATDVFNRLYSNDLPPVRFLRDLGMAAVDRLPLARRLFTRDAGADLGELPSLLRT
jgi:2-octaprenyl-6-methoxyphenol hydroxylase